MLLYFSKDLYPKSALIKTAYNFTDRAYIYLQQNETDYIIDIKDKSNDYKLLDEFKNEMLAQTARYEIYKQTKEIRELIVARGMASTVLQNNNSIDTAEDFDVSNILKDWFEDNE